MLSLQLRKFDSGVLEHALKNLRALANLVEAFLDDSDGVGLQGECLPMLNEVLLELFVKLIRSTTTVGEEEEDLGRLVNGEVAEQTLINKLGLERLPQFIILELHLAGSLNDLEDARGALSVESLNLLLDARKNDVPELGRLGQVIECDVIKGVANLSVSQILGVLLENESVILAVVAGLHGGVDLVEDVVGNVVKIVVAARVQRSDTGRHLRRLADEHGALVLHAGVAEHELERTIVLLDGSLSALGESLSNRSEHF